MNMSEKQHRYFIINKPYNMVSQFVSTHDVGLLSDLDFDFPENTHAIGRLDNHSEGLLILTTNKKVTRLLFSSAIAHKRTYLVQVKKNFHENISKWVKIDSCAQNGNALYADSAFISQKRN